MSASSVQLREKRSLPTDSEQETEKKQRVPTYDSQIIIASSRQLTYSLSFEIPLKADRVSTMRKMQASLAGFIFDQIYKRGVPECVCREKVVSEIDARLTQQLRMETDGALVEALMERNLGETKQVRSTPSRNPKLTDSQYEIACVFVKKKFDEYCALKRESSKESVLAWPPVKEVASSKEMIGDRFGAAQSIGRRPQQEDRYVTGEFELNLSSGETLPVAIAAVADGHGGFEAAEFIAKNLQKFLKDDFVRCLKKEEALTSLRIYNNLKVLFPILSQQIISKNITAGAVVSALIKIGQDLYCVTVGDVRVICFSDDEAPCMPLSVEVKKSESKSFESALKRGASRTGVARLESPYQDRCTINVSNAVGDLFWGGLLSPRGKIVKVEAPKSGWALLVSDGISDIFSDDEMKRLVLSRLKDDDSLDMAAAFLVHAARKIGDARAAGISIGNGDNMTALIWGLS